MKQTICVLLSRDCSFQSLCVDTLVLHAVHSRVFLCRVACLHHSVFLAVDVMNEGRS